MRTSKLLITSLLAAAAMSVPAWAETVVDGLLPTLSGTGDFTYLQNSQKGDTWNTNLGANSVSETVVAQDLVSAPELANPGWHWGLGQKNPSFSGMDISNVSATGFTFLGRGGYTNEYVTATVDLSTLLGGDKKITDLSISFTGTSANGNGTGENHSNFTFSVWAWDGSFATQIYKSSGGITASGTSISFTENDLSLCGADKLFVVWGDNSSGGRNTISNLTTSYTTTSAFSTLYWRGNAEGETWSSSSTQWNATSSETTGNVAATSVDDVIFDSDASVAVDSGGVRVSHFSVTGGTVSFSGGAITAWSGVSVSNGATLALGNALTTSQISLDNGVLQSNATLALASNVSVETAGEIKVSSDKLTLNGAISASGATLTKSGTGTLVVNGGASGEKLSIEGGELQAIGSASVTNPLSFNDIVIKSGAKLYLDTQKSGDANSLTWSRLTFEGGTFHVYDTQTNTNFLTVNDVVMNGAGTITSTWSNSGGTVGATLGNLSGTGNLTITNTTSADSEPLAWKISQIASDYSGTISLVKNNKALTVSIGSSSAEGANFNVGSNAALKFTGTGAYSLGTLTMGSGATLSIASSGVTLKGLSGTGAISLAAGTAASTLTVNQASDTTFAGTIADGIALKKAGTGTLILSGDNSAYAGTVTLEAGTLGVGHANALGTSTVNVTGDANLQMDALAVSAFANDVSVADGKTLSVQAHATDFTGALSGNGNVAVKTLTYSESDVLALSGDNTALAGTLSVEGLASVNAKHVNALGSGMLKIKTTDVYGTGTVTIGTVNAAVAGVKLNAVSISLKDAATAVLTADASCNFTVAEGATLYLDIGALGDDVLTGDEVALTIAAASAFDNSFFSAVEVGTYGEDGSWVKDLQWAYVEGSWNVDAGTLSIAIPEPSVFGLLAGLGALALAGTRRRRKKA